MPDLNIEKLIFFLFAVLPGFIAMQVYGLKSSVAKRDWGNSLVEVVTYSLINLTVWLGWVLRIVRMPFNEVHTPELTAAIILVCFISPTLLSLSWYKLRISLLHRQLRMDHPTPRGWDHFIRENHEFWVLFHWKSGKLSGGYFGGNSYASTYPHDPEIYVEELWRVDEEGVFIEVIPNTLGGVVRISECEHVEFLKVEMKETDTNGQQAAFAQGAVSLPHGGEAGQNGSGTNGNTVVAC